MGFFDRLFGRAEYYLRILTEAQAEAKVLCEAIEAKNWVSAARSAARLRDLLRW